MRTSDSQLILTGSGIEHPHAAELEKIGEILKLNPAMGELVTQDLIAGVENPDTGARGLTGDQVLRILIVKQMNGFSYDELAFHLADSVTYRSFCGLSPLEKTPARSTLAENLKKLTQETLEAVHREIVKYAAGIGVERGRRVRIDATVTETNIHEPSDSSLLFDGVRVLTRLFGEARELFGFTQWSDHTKRAKRRMLDAQRTRSRTARTRAYEDLLKVTRWCLEYGDRAVAYVGASTGGNGARAVALRGEIGYYAGLLRRVISQTERRIFEGESVPAEDKVVSLFEPHTDIIRKDGRDTFFGHKIYLAGGASGLITDCFIARGNPADSSMALPMLRRQREIYGRPPRQAAFDGGFAATDNVRNAKALGVTDVCFHKKRGIKITDMVRSSWVYKRLRDFRAGIEGVISFLKRAFGLGRCTWRGAASFGTYVMASVVSANLLMLARQSLG